MAKFSYANIEELEYDFTGAPANNGGFCRGKGVVPEPTKDRRDAFLAIRETYAGAIEDAKEGKLTAEEMEAKYPDLKEGLMHTLISELCGGSPSVEELEELPPRVFSHFAKWILEEVYDPKG